MKPSPFLLADSSICLRMLALRDLDFPGFSVDELSQLEGLAPTDPLVLRLVRLQREDGSWSARDLNPGWGAGSSVMATGYALSSLGYLGFGVDFPAVRRGVDFLFAQQELDGSWPLNRQVIEGDIRETERGYTLVPLQTALPLRGIAAVGMSQDPRSEKAYEWLLEQRLEDGAWPTGWASGVHGYVAGYRRLAHSRWGCRSNTTGSLLCLALHPTRRMSDAARRGLDLLLGREANDPGPIGLDVARLVGVEPPSGFFTYYQAYDLAMILDLCWRLEIDARDSRVQSIVNAILQHQGKQGLWDVFRPQAKTWISFDLTRSLSRLGTGVNWDSQEPSTPFHPYPHRPKRF